MSDAFLIRRGGSIGSGFPVFTYSGDYLFVDDGGGSWRLKLLTSGDLVFTHPNSAAKGVDAFLVGAGGGCYDGGGGGGGYTKTLHSLSIDKNRVYPITIGACGLKEDGGQTVAFGHIAEGGKAGGKVVRWAGGAGGSGGGGWSGNGLSGGAGGSDGSDGVAGKGAGAAAGIGQGTSTREFGESTGELYSGGGGGGGSPAGAGGAGGGGTGGVSGTPNTGGGGGGGSTSGGSGIVIIRKHREVDD